jgi:hypothetical protein
MSIALSIGALRNSQNNPKHQKRVEALQHVLKSMRTLQPNPVSSTSTLNGDNFKMWST